LNRALRLEPNKAADIILQTGVGTYYQNQYAWAVEVLSQLIANRPEPKILYSALVHRGAARGYLGQKQNALKDFESALQIDNQDPFLFYMRAVTVFAAGKEFDRAIEDLNYALTFHPYPSLTLSIYLNRSDYHAQKNEFNLARDDLNQALRLDPHNQAIHATINNLANLYSAKGDIFKRKGQYEMAHQCYSEAILLNPQNPRPFSGRAFAGILKGDKKEAIPDLQNACQLGHQNACHILEILQK
jgi:tetratricopeptide (TPR) repeat protein